VRLVDVGAGVAAVGFGQPDPPPRRGPGRPGDPATAGRPRPITQDVGDLLGSDIGQVIIANAATQILLRQAPQAIDVVADAFGLTAGEARLLLGARRGEGLLLSGTHRVSFHAVASKKEHRLCVGDLELADDG
jgi:hypothetical protein